MPLVAIAVRNVSKTNLILSGERSVEWGYAGIPDGSDVQEVPEEMWVSAHMRKAVARGLLVEATKDDLDAAYVTQRATIDEAAAERDAMISGIIDNSDSNSMVITSDAMDEHIRRMSAQQHSDVNDQVSAPSPAEAPNPMDAINGAIG